MPAGLYQKMEQLTKKRKILWLFAHMHKGGMQRAVSNISLALPDEFQQHIAYFGTENPGFPYKGKLHDLNVPGSLNLSKTRRIINGYRRIKLLRRHIEELGIDVVISFGESANFYNIASHHGAKKILTCRVATAPEKRRAHPFKRAIKLFSKAKLYGRADNIVAVSEELGNEIATMIGDKSKVRVIPNLYHIKKIESMAQEPLPGNYKFLEEEPFILNVGSFIYQKGQDDLLKVYAGLFDKMSEPPKLVLMGRGEWEEGLKSLVCHLGIQDKVIFVDFDPNPFRFMARAKVFILTSRFEGFPNVLVEAMICGAPVVAFDCPTGPKEILQDNKYGFIIENRNKSQAIDVLSRLVLDKQLRQQFCAFSKRRGRHFSASAVIKKWISVLK